MNKVSLRLLALVLSFLLLSGCAENNTDAEGAMVTRASPVTRLQPVYYTVQEGDTLSSIAARFHLSYQTVARENKLAPPYRIYVGQKLLIGMAAANASTKPANAKSEHESSSLRNTTGSSVHPLAAPTKLQGQSLDLSAYGATTGKVYVQGKPLTLPPPTKAELPARTIATQLVQQANEPATEVEVKHLSKVSKAGTKNYSQSSGNKISSASTQITDEIKWSWPVSGIIVSQFGADQGLQGKGVQLQVRAATRVLAAAQGVVLYSGEVAKGYGKMIIIKHKNNFLTAYTNLSKILVKEGQKVNLGEPIAISGTIQGKSELHFEIRRFGNPVDPLKYMPTP